MGGVWIPLEKKLKCADRWLFGGLPLVFFVTEDTWLVFLDK